MSGMGKAESEAAAALANGRWKKTTKKERTEVAREMLAARWGEGSEERRKEVGKRLAAARAKKRAIAKKVAIK